MFQVLPITDDETGDQVSHHKHASDEVAASSSGSDLNITKAKSLEVLVPKGKYGMHTIVISDPPTIDLHNY